MPDSRSGAGGAESTGTACGRPAQHGPLLLPEADHLGVLQVAPGPGGLRLSTLPRSAALLPLPVLQSPQMSVAGPATAGSIRLFPGPGREPLHDLIQSFQV